MHLYAFRLQHCSKVEIAEQCWNGFKVLLWLYSAGTYLQPHYGNGVFGNVYLSAGQHKEVNIAGTPLP